MLERKNLQETHLSLLVNNEETTLEKELMNSLRECKSFQFNVAFVTFGCVQLFKNIFNELAEKGVHGRFITSTYLEFSEPKALRELLNMPNIELKVYTDTKNRGYHTKAYIFEREDDYKIIIGSSNFTTSALRKNIEWNALIITKKEIEFTTDINDEFEMIWESLDRFTESQIDQYEAFYKDWKEFKKEERRLFEDEVLVPNAMQVNALKSLDFLRKQGEKKALVIAATATGKTYMSIFDVKNQRPNRVLFVAHVENILDAAMESFKRVLGKSYTYSKFIGVDRKNEGDVLFSTNLTLSNSLSSFTPYDFDYIIIDEAHRAAASTYQDFISYFKPKFLLGMTATPERTDDGNIFELFDRNVALEVRLDEAIENNLVVPFHYFGITDIDEVNLEGVDLSEIDVVANRLMIHSRTEFILDRMNFYKYDGEKLKGLGFCVSVKHAEFMEAEFNKAGIESISISGDMKPSERQNYFRRLEDDSDSLRMIFAVDVLNEGVDIPSVNLVLMLRPTNSPIVFTQQLGRGLRKYNGKNYLTVLDFIGNHNRAFLIALALSGSKVYDKDSIKVMVEIDYGNGPKEVFIQMDEIAKKRILKQLNAENFGAMKYLREEYNNFKTARRGKIPYFLMDYLGVTNAPDPLKFFGSSNRKTYYDFLSQVERNNEYIHAYHKHEFLKKITHTLSVQLPLIRPYEFLILKYLLNNHSVKVRSIVERIKGIVEGTDETTVLHAIDNLDQAFLDSNDLRNYQRLIVKEDDTIALQENLRKLLMNDMSRSIILDVVEYGLAVYFEEFSSISYGYPFLKLYHPYSMKDVALAANVTNKHSSFRGSGVIPWKNMYFLFVDLHKDKGIAESINYNDKIISNIQFQWESQNSTSQRSRVGKNLIHHKEKGFELHLFVRKQAQMDGQVMRYIYFGQVDVMSYENEKPIKFQFKLRERIPASIMTEMTTIVE